MFWCVWLSLCKEQSRKVAFVSCVCLSYVFLIFASKSKRILFGYLPRVSSRKKKKDNGRKKKEKQEKKRREYIARSSSYMIIVEEINK